MTEIPEISVITVDIVTSVSLARYRQHELRVRRARRDSIIRIYG